MALVSVILPCFNVEKYIDRVLESLIRQTIGLENIEIICVDDASTDGTMLKLAVWEEQYSDNILIVKCQENRRQGTARNIGLSYASAPYIAFIDSDDWVEPDYLKCMYDLITEKQLQVVTCGIRRDSSTELTYFSNTDEGNGTGIVLVNSPEDRKKLIMHQPFGGACCKLIDKQFLLEHALLYPEGMAYEDLYWREVLHLHITRGMIVDRCLYHYFVNDSSTVLKFNETYHYDYFTIVTMLWDYWERNGFLNEYRHELEYEYLIVAGLQIFKVLALRFDTPQYSMFQLLQTLIRNRIPSISTNPYISGSYFDEKQLLLINAMYMNMTRTDFVKLLDSVKVLGI